MTNKMACRHLCTNPQDWKRSNSVVKLCADTPKEFVKTFITFPLPEYPTITPEQSALRI